MKGINLSPERLAELLRRYPHEANRTLSTEFGVSEERLCKLAHSHRVRKTALARSGVHKSSTSLALDVQNVVRASGDRGMSRHEAIAALPKRRGDSVCNTLHLLTERGYLHRAGQPRHLRWFTELAHALAHNARLLEGGTPGVRVPEQRGPAHCDGPAVETAATRRTQCLQPSSAQALSHGLFATLKPGHYIDAEAKPWVRAITTKDPNARGAAA